MTFFGQNFQLLPVRYGYVDFSRNLQIRSFCILRKNTTQVFAPGGDCAFNTARNFFYFFLRSWYELHATENAVKHMDVENNELSYSH
jgi:hypothetical protein